MVARMLRVSTLLLGVLLLGACATKKDVRTLSDNMASMRAHQDTVLLNLQRQNRLLLDSIRAAMQISLNTGGTTAARLREFDDNVNRLTQLMAQVTTGLNRIEQRLTALDQRLTALERERSQQMQGAGNPEQLMVTGMQKMSEQSWTAARLAFETLIAQFPQDERAPAAQYQIGESYVLEEEFDDAYAAFDAVAERWPDAPRARAALLRAGVVAQDRRDRSKARAYYQRVIRDYPNTDEAREASRRLPQVR